VRVTSDRQTLILAGETPPRRSLASSSSDDAESRVTPSSQRVTIISARVDASMIVTQSDYTPDTSVVAYDSVVAAGREVGSALPAAANTQLAAMTAKGQLAYASSSRGSSYNAAGAYARTRDLSDRLPIIDTYA
jgi:hypothetical protein